MADVNVEQTGTTPGGGTRNGSGNTALAVVLIIIAVALAAFMLFNRTDPADNNADVMAPETENGEMIEAEESSDATEVEEEAAIRTVMVTATEFVFSPSEIRVNEGDTVKIIFNNEEGFHDFVLDEFNVATSQFMGPGTEEVEFVADRAGEFEFYCSVGEHRAMGMVGTLIVE